MTDDEHNYPVPLRHGDGRFDGLVDDVTAALVLHGYPPVVAESDRNRLQFALHSFLFMSDGQVPE